MIIRINRLRFYAYHGVLDRERKVGQEFEVDLALNVEGYDGSDRLESTLNYAEVIDVVKEEMSTPSNLIEYVGRRIADRLVGRFPQIAGGSVTVRKLRPPVEAELDSVEVVLEIQNTEYKVQN